MKSGEARDEDEGSSEEDEGFGGIGAELVVFAESAEVVEPAKGAFDDPTPWQDLEAFLGVAAPDNLQAQRALAEALSHPSSEFVTRVAAVGPDEFELGEGLIDFIEQQCGPVAVLHAGGMDTNL